MFISECERKAPVLMQEYQDTNVFSGQAYLFVDNYPNHRFEIAEVDFKAHQFRWLNDFEYSLPEDEVRHCSIIKVTEEELQGF